MQGVSYNNFCLQKQRLLMSPPELPSEFDVVVVGTGLEESMVAASAARNGHTVLHLDHEDYYGGDWAAFNFNGLAEWIRKRRRKESDDDDRDDDDVRLVDGERLVRLNRADGFVRDVRDKWFLDDEDDEDGKRWTRRKIVKNSRRFNLDLTARLLFGRGAMVDLLISSNVSRYAEFKSVSRVLTRMPDGRLEHVPSSRADVFATKNVSVVEKRILMKFIASVCRDDDGSRNPERRTFGDHLRRDHRLTDNLLRFVVDSVAMVREDAPVVEGLEATRKFLTSIGRFGGGNTPFLWSMYGSGELPQAFCRLCAVFGGVYFLGKPLRSVIVDGHAVKAVAFNGQRIGCKRLVVDSRRWPEELKEGRGGQRVTVRRKVCLLSDSVRPADKEQLTFVNLPPSCPSSSNVQVVEVGFGTAACPKGMYVLHMTAEGEEELDEARVLGDASQLMWSLAFTNVVEKNASVAATASNVHLCSGPEFELDYDEAIRRARSIYADMFPDEEFLPRAPDPEEILLGGDDDDEEEEEKEHS